MNDRNSYRHKHYDVSILQSRTVNNMVESLKEAKKYKNIDEVLRYLFELHNKAKTTGVGRKANTVDKKIAKLKAMGITINKENK